MTAEPHIIWFVYMIVVETNTVCLITLTGFLDIVDAASYAKDQGPAHPGLYRSCNTVISQGHTGSRLCVFLSRFGVLQFLA